MPPRKPVSDFMLNLVKRVMDSRGIAESTAAEYVTAMKKLNDDMENGWDDSYDDSMDGDHDSAMESAGWGTDEDYGYYGDDTPMYDDYYGGE